MNRLYSISLVIGGLTIALLIVLVIVIILIQPSPQEGLVVFTTNTNWVKENPHYILLFNYSGPRVIDLPDDETTKLRDSLKSNHLIRGIHFDISMHRNDILPTDVESWGRFVQYVHKLFSSEYLITISLEPNYALSGTVDIHHVYHPTLSIINTLELMDYVFVSSTDESFLSHICTLLKYQSPQVSLKSKSFIEYENLMKEIKNIKFLNNVMSDDLLLHSSP